MGIILDGKRLKDKVLSELKTLDNNSLGLVVIQIGNDDASNVYIKQKKMMAEALNMKFSEELLPSDITTNEVIEIIEKYNKDDDYNGVLLQLPIPKHIDYDLVVDAIDSNKDIDGLRNNSKFMPCTVLGILKLLEEYQIDTINKRVVIIGKSRIVGKPLADYFKNQGNEVIVCDTKTIDLKQEILKADILISAAGIPKLVTKDMIKEGVIVIDVGMNRVDNKLVGDVDFENVKDKCSFITPVPGGVGATTIAGLAINLVYGGNKYGNR